MDALCIETFCVGVLFLSEVIATTSDFDFLKEPKSYPHPAARYQVFSPKLFIPIVHVETASSLKLR